MLRLTRRGPLSACWKMTLCSPFIGFRSMSLVDPGSKTERLHISSISRVEYRQTHNLPIWHLLTTCQVATLFKRKQKSREDEHVGLAADLTATKSRSLVKPPGLRDSRPVALSLTSKLQRAISFCTACSSSSCDRMVACRRPEMWRSLFCNLWISRAGAMPSASRR